MSRAQAVVLGILAVLVLVAGLVLFWGKSAPEAASLARGVGVPTAGGGRPTHADQAGEQRAREAESLRLRREIERLLDRVAELEEALARSSAPSASRQALAPDAAQPMEPASAAERAPARATSAASRVLSALDPERFGALGEEELAALTELELQDLPLTDEDLRAIAELPSLERLGLHGTAITDAGLAWLTGLQRLAHLDLRGTAVSRAGLAWLPNGLQALHLTDTRVVGDDLFRMAAMPELATLKLNSLALDDGALAALSAYPGLRHLELDRTAITDEGLLRLLEQHPLLARIELRGTRVTADGLARSAERYPACEIVTD